VGPPAATDSMHVDARRLGTHICAMAEDLDQTARADSPWVQERGFLLALFALAVCVRLLFYWFAYDTPLFGAPMVDESWHDTWARQLVAQGGHYESVFFRAPLYPYFLAALYAVSDGSVAFARAFQLLISSISVVLFYVLARGFLSRRLARIAAIALCFYGTLIWYEQALLIPVVIIFLDLLLLYLLLRYQKSRSWLTLALAGGVAGLSMVARPNLAVFVAGVGVVLLMRDEHATEWAGRIKRTALFLAVAALPVIPVAAHNYAYSGDFIPVASQGGINFYLGNNPVADGLTMRMPEILINEDVSWDEFVPLTDSLAREARGRMLSPGEISSFWMGRFGDYVVSEPGGFVSGLLRKTYFLFAGVENSDNFDLYFYRHLNPVYAAMVWRAGLHFPFGLVSPLAILGLVVLWPKRRQWRWLYLFVLLYAPTVIGVLVTARHRLPLVPVFLLFAVAGTALLFERWRDMSAQHRVGWGTAAVILFVFLNLELFGVGFTNLRQSHLNLALAHKKLEQTDAMVARLDSALAIDSSSALALNNRGIVFLDEGDLYMAKKLFRRALDFKPESMEIRNNLATVLMKMGEWERARMIYSQVMRQQRTMAEPFYNVARIYSAQGNLDSALAYYDSALVRDSLYVQAINNKGSVYEAMGDTARAEIWWRRALATDLGYATPGMNLVRYYRSRKDFGRARSTLGEAESPWRNSADWYYESAQVELDVGDTAAARRVVSESLQLYPDHRPTRFVANRLGPTP
jgi:tetratricopeptide (TPR) repeat protein/4-amino-4-deoxy-L-arabinose transferase-like glycosyltransferase